MSILSKQQQQHWAEHLQAWRESGLSQQAYCQQQGLKPHQFWYWKRKLSGPGKAEVAEDEQPVKEFVPVTVSQPVYPADGLILTLPGGISLSGITPHNVLLARQLMEGFK